MEQTNRTRITWADSMKAFSIMAVVLFHTQIMPEIQTAAYLVCLPAFFFVAGLFTNTSLSLREFFEKKTLRLMIPYLIWGLLSWAFWYFLSSKYGSSVESEVPWWKPLVGMLYGRGADLIQNVPLWFLCCMMSLEWIYYGVCRISQQWVRWIVIIGLGIVGCILAHKGQNWVWGITAALIILPVYAIGAEYKSFFKTQMSALSIYKITAILLVSLIGLWLGYTYNGNIALFESNIGNPILYYTTALSAIGLWLAVSLLLEKSKNHFTQLIQYIGRNTLFILCAHMMLFGCIKGVAFICHVPIEFWRTTIGSLVLWVSTLILIFPLTFLVNRYFPILIASPFPLRTKTDEASSKLSDKRL